MIPDWNAAGFVPPVRPGVLGASEDRSPYNVPLLPFVQAFCTSDQRAHILHGLLKYRSKLYDLECTSGFQWLNGSFCENIELNAMRAPRDIDVVSFLKLPSSFTDATLATNSDIFDNNEAKAHYQVDAYFLELGHPFDSWHSNNVAYWYSLWSHTRANQWKGFFQIELSPDDDKMSMEFLDNYLSNGGQK